MAEPPEMSAPITRSDLREELEPIRAEIATLATKDELRATKDDLREELREAVAPLATKAEIAALASKAELREAIARLATKEELQAAFALFATKEELRAAIAPLATKAEIATLATKAEMDHRFEIWGGALLDRISKSEQHVLSELARHANAIQESLRVQIVAVDDKYADLPERVSRLERERDR